MIDLLIEWFDNMSHYEQASFSWLLAMYTANFFKKTKLSILCAIISLIYVFLGGSENTGDPLVTLGAMLVMSAIIFLITWFIHGALSKKFVAICVLVFFVGLAFMGVL